jgi:hypothetical protein
MGQINKIKILGKTIQSQKPTFSISSPMKSAELFTLIQNDANGNKVRNIDFNISLKSLKSYNASIPVFDEILIDLVEQKTYHIRRVGISILHSLTGGYKANGELFSGYTIPKDLESNLAFEPNSYVYSYCDKMCTQEAEIESFNANKEFCGNLNGDITDKWFFKIKASTVGKNTNQSFLEWSQKTPITIYAKLLQPIITEIEHIQIDPLATDFDIDVSENALKPNLVIEYEKDYKIAIKEVETEIDNAQNDIVELRSIKSDKPSLKKVLIDIPTWTNQPTISGSLNESFETSLTNYYFVTLKEMATTVSQASAVFTTTTVVIIETTATFSIGNEISIGGCSILENNKTATITNVSNNGTQSTYTFASGTFTAGTSTTTIIIGTMTNLPSGQFKLMLWQNAPASAINQIFSLASLATGNSGTLAENTEVDFKTIGINYALRLHFLSSLLEIAIDGNLQTNNFSICISGQIRTSQYLYLNFIPFTSNYRYIGNVGNYEGGNGFLLSPIGIAYKKIIMEEFSANIIRCKKTTQANVVRTNFASNTLTGSPTINSATVCGVSYKSDKSDIDTIPITKLSLTGVRYANGTEITIKEL